MTRLSFAALLCLTACRDFQAAYLERLDAGFGGGGEGGGSTTGGGGEGGGSAACDASFCFVDRIEVPATAMSIECTTGVYAGLDRLRVFCQLDSDQEVFVGSDGGLMIRSSGTDVRWHYSDGPLSDFWLTDYRDLYRGNGTTLTKQHQPCGDDANNVHVQATGDVWVASAMGTYCHLLPDGGETPVAVPGVTSNLNAIFVSGGEVLVGTFDGAIHRSNGAQELSGTDYINAIDGIDLAHVWAATEDGHLLERQVDAGWRTIRQSGAPFYDVHVISESEVFAAGPAGIVHREADGGWVDLTAASFGITNMVVFGVRGDADGLVVYGQTVSANAGSAHDGVVARVRRGR